MVVCAGALFTHGIVSALMLTFAFPLASNVAKVIPLAYCCYWKHKFKLSDLLSRAALKKKKSVHSTAKDDAEVLK